MASLLRSERGSFLLSAMVFVSVISILVTAAWQIVSNQDSSWRRTRILNARDLVVISALRNSRVASYYYYTLLQPGPTAAEFRKCMIDDGIGEDCVSLEASGEKKVHSVTLIDENEKPIIGGSSSSPVRYDLYGQVCETASFECSFEVYGSFTVICKDDAPVCAQAYEIVFTVHVKVSDLLEKMISNVALTNASQKISISNYQTEFFPVLPPATPTRGAPLSFGAGPSNWSQTYGAGGGSSGGGGGGGSGGSAVPPQSVNTNTCSAGTAISPGGSGCAKFNF